MTVFNKSIRPLLNELDFFSHRHNFTFNKQSGHSSIPGIICSLILMVVLAVFLILGLIKVASGQVVSSSQSVLPGSSGGSREIVNDGKTFMIALEVTNLNSGSAQNNPMIAITEQNTTHFNQIQTEQCTIQHFESVNNIDT